MPSSAPTVPLSPAARAHAWLPSLELCLLGALWGASYLFMRVAVPHLGAVVLVELRLALGALVLLPLLWRVRARVPARAWPKLVAIGAVNTALPALLFAWAAGQAPAGISAIASGTTVLLTAVVGALGFGERIGRRRATALAIGFAGIAVLAGGGTEGANVAGAAAAGVAAALCYAVGIHLVRRHLSELPPAAVAAATLGTSALLALPFALAQRPALAAIPVDAWLCALALGVVCTGVAYVLYYRLVARIGPGRTSTVNYVVPVFGVLWAWMWLGEPLTPTMAAAGLCVLGSVAISQRAPK